MITFYSLCLLFFIQFYKFCLTHDLSMSFLKTFLKIKASRLYLHLSLSLTHSLDFLSYWLSFDFLVPTPFFIFIFFKNALFKNKKILSHQSIFIYSAIQQVHLDCQSKAKSELYPSSLPLFLIESTNQVINCQLLSFSFFLNFQFIINLMDMNMFVPDDWYSLIDLEYWSKSNTAKSFAKTKTW